jgi:hypothetical protein
VAAGELTRGAVLLLLLLAVPAYGQNHGQMSQGEFNTPPHDFMPITPIPPTPSVTYENGSYTVHQHGWLTYDESGRIVVHEGSDITYVDPVCCATSENGVTVCDTDECRPSDANELRMCTKYVPGTEEQ